MGEQPSDKTQDSYPRQYARTRRFTCGEPRSIEVVQNSVLFLRSQGGSDPVNCLWRISIDSESGKLGHEQLLIDPSALHFNDDADALPAEERSRRERMREQASGITGYSLSDDGNFAVFTLAGQVLLADISDPTAIANVRALETPLGSFDARISPNGEFVAYVHDGDLHVIHVAGADVVLAHDDDPNISWGMADFNAAEEFDRYRGFWWSPDSSQLLVAKVDNNPVQVWWIADPAHPDREPTQHRYPVAGSANAIVSLSMIGIDGTQIPIDLTGTHPDMEYLVSASWTRHGAVVTTLNREQTDQRVIRVQPNGNCEQLHQCTDQQWIELIPGTPRICEAGLVHTVDVLDTLDGERGRRSLTTTDTKTGATVQTAFERSPGNLLINTVAVVGDDGRALCTVTNHDLGAQFTQVVRIGNDGTTQTIAGEPSDLGIHSVAASTEEIVVIRSASLNRDRPEFRVIVNGTLAGHIESLAEVPLVDPQPIFLTAGVRSIPVAVLLPSDPSLRAESTKLPVIMDPYGGPHAARVIATRSAMASSQWLADQGFAVVIVDGRGTPGVGPNYERAVFRDLAGPPLADQVVGLLGAAAHVPQIDLSRVGIRGWSFGGYLAALAVLRRPDVFHCAVAGAPVTDWRLYDTGYTERYLGNPAEDDEPYEKSSLLNEATSLTRPLQLIHGLADDNVVAAHTLQFSSALVAAGIPHEVIPLSGVTHMTPQEEVAENMLLLQVDFLRRHLGAPIGQPKEV